MKHSKTITFILCMLSLVMLAHSQIPPSDGASMGLVSELSDVKLTAEQKLLTLIHGKTPDAISKDSVLMKAVTDYQKARASYDQIILQLIADIRLKAFYRKLSTYRKLNRVLTRKTIEHAQSGGLWPRRPVHMLYALQVARTQHDHFTQTTGNKIIQMQTRSLVLPGLSEAYEVLSGIIGKVKESNEARAEKVIAILDALRWKSVQELQKDQSTPN